MKRLGVNRESHAKAAPRQIISAFATVVHCKFTKFTAATDCFPILEAKIMLISVIANEDNDGDLVGSGM